MNARRCPWTITLTALSVLLVLSASGFASTTTAAQESTPGPLPVPFEAWLSAWATDPAGADTLYTPDAILEDMAAGAAFRGLAEIKSHIEEEFAGFPDHTYDVQSAVVAGDLAVAEVVFSGTYTGTYAGLPPGDGQVVSLRVAVIIELDGNQIRREAHYYDSYAFLVQLGLLPAPSAEASPTA